MAATLCSVRVGMPRLMGSAQDAWMSSFQKTEVEGRVRVGRENLCGDQQADRTVHGGPDKAICVYPAEHYVKWSNELVEPACGPGWFGENFTVLAQDEGSVCVGDIYRVGSSLLEVAQPRGPCWKLAKRWSRPDLPMLCIQTGRTGWYLRVRQEGHLAAADEFVLCERPHPECTIARVNRVMYAPPEARDRSEVQFLAGCAALAPGWRNRLSDIAERLRTPA